MTTRRLVLVRHAKSKADGGIDTERPLAKRGETDAPGIGRWLAQHGLVPDRVVVSPARRARQTWELAAAELGATPQPVLDQRVYGNTVDDLLEVVRETPAGVDTLVLVGHNPSIEALAGVLDDGAGDTAARRELEQGYPTSGIAVFAVSKSWPDVDTAAGTLASFATPGR